MNLIAVAAKKIINGIKITDFERVKDILFSEVNLSAVRSYALDRLLTIHELYESDSWEQEVRFGYYGEELGKLLINESIWRKLEEHWRAIQDLNSTKIIEYILNLEYGMVPDQYQNLDWEIRTVDRDKIVISNLMHFNRSASEFYKNYQGPRCVVKQQGEKFNLIDGYHRLASCEDKSILAVLGK